MGTITTTDGTEIFYKDWGAGQPIVFSHGWPLSADDWDTQMLFFLQHGYRVIAHDRRGHGRSTQTGDGHDMDHYADDLAALTAHLDLHDAVHVGHSTGGGEVAHYIARHGESRVAKAVLISAVPPLMLQTDANPGGLPKSVFDDLQAQLAANRSVFYRALASGPFYGFNRPGVESSEAIIENWWRQGMMGGAKAHYDGIVAFSQTDFTEDLKKISVPVLVMHGDDDQIVPYADSGPLSAELLQNGTLKTYHGLPARHAHHPGGRRSTPTCSPSSSLEVDQYAAAAPGDGFGSRRGRPGLRYHVSEPAWRKVHANGVVDVPVSRTADRGLPRDRGAGGDSQPVHSAGGNSGAATRRRARDLLAVDVSPGGGVCDPRGVNARQ